MSLKILVAYTVRPSSPRTALETSSVTAFLRQYIIVGPSKLYTILKSEQYQINYSIPNVLHEHVHVLYVIDVQV